MSTPRGYIRNIPTIFVAAGSLTAGPMYLDNNPNISGAPSCYFGSATKKAGRSEDEGTSSEWAPIAVGYFTFSEERTTVEAPWTPIKKLSSFVLNGYGAYERPNWDGFGSHPISSLTLSAAHELLNTLNSEIPAPEAAPGGDGTIGLEWWNGKARLFIDVGPKLDVRTYFNPGNGKSSEEFFQWGDSRLGAHLEKLFGQLYGRFAETGGTSSLVVENIFYDRRSSELVNPPTALTYGSGPSRDLTTSDKTARAYTIAL